MTLAVLGAGPLGRSIAASFPCSTLLLDEQVVPGPWLSRRIDPNTGEGIRSALAGAERLLVILERPAEWLGLYLILRADAVSRRVVFVLPTGVSAPAWTSAWPQWSTFSLGYPWGKGDPLFDGFANRSLRSCPKLDSFPTVPFSEAQSAVLAAFEFPGSRWSWGGEIQSLQGIAASLGGPLRRAWWPARWARHTGVSWSDIVARSGSPGSPRNTPGWEPAPVENPPDVPAPRLVDVVNGA